MTSHVMAAGRRLACRMLDGTIPPGGRQQPAGTAPSQRTAAAMLDLLVTNATLPDGRTGMSLAVQGGRITEVTAGLQAPARETVDANGSLLSPHFCDPHFHMDATLSYGLPR